MSRRRRSEKRVFLPDAKYDSIWITQFINIIFQKGKTSKAKRIVYDALDYLEKKVGEGKPLELFIEAVENIRPAMEVKSIRVGGANYQVPIEVPSYRSTVLAFRWLANVAKSRNEKGMIERLGAELVQAYNKEGNAVRKKIETHKMADANKAFAHFNR